MYSWDSTFERNELQRQRAWELSQLTERCKLMSTRELFYGEKETTFLVKNIKGTNPRPELVLASMPFYPDTADAKNGGGAEEEKKKKDPDVVLYVPMCCGQCEERISVPVSEMEGVKSVQCNWYKKKVIVSGKALNAMPILLKCRSIFPKSATWKD